MKSGKDDKNPYSNKWFDALFDIHLKPLKSKYARTIFKVLVEERKVGALTTLDIQTKLDGIGLKLEKKEINGWLRSLLGAELVSRDEERGKPTTIDYSDKYTFDLWRLTDIGAKVAERLPQVLGTKLSFFKGDAAETLQEIANKGRYGRTQILRHVDELYLLARILNRLLEAGGELKKAKLIKKNKPSDNEIDRLLLNYSNQRRPTLIIKKHRPHGIKITLLRILGFISDKDFVYALTDEGRQLAKVLSLGGDIGHQSRL